MITLVKSKLKKNMNKLLQVNDTVTVIKPKTGFNISDLKELKDYRELFFSFVWRDVKVLYAQTIFGFTWAILNPLVQIIIYTIIFGRVAKLSTDGIPYMLFSSVAIIPWTYMSDAMNTSSQSLISGQGMLGKIYFPRLIFPLVSVLSKLVNFSIGFVIILGMLIYYHITPTWNLLFLPVFVVLMVCIPAGVGMWFSSMAIRFRDVRFAMQFFIRMLMWSSPIVYPVSAVPEKYRIIYSINPLVGVIEGFRACLLGTPIQWQYIWLGMIVTIIIFVSSLFYFKRMEHMFTDVI